MDYKIEKQKNSQLHLYDKSELDLAYAFSKEAYKEFQPILKGIILFGSTARSVATKESDIDILIVLDDISAVLSKELMETYKIITEKIIQKVSPRIHVTTLRFTTFFDYIRIGDPIGINILRDGVALVDTGFFDPMQVLLKQGRLRPTFESIWTYFNRSPITLHNSRWHLLRACEDLYWAVTDAAHAALMKLGNIPPSPAHLADLIEEKMVKKRLLDKKHAQTVRLFYDLYKGISRRTIKDLTGSQYEKYYVQAHEFVHEIEKFLNRKDI